MKSVLLGVNAFFLVSVNVLGLLVDANGRVLGLSTGVSIAVTTVMFSGAFIAAALLAIRGSGWSRGLSIVLGLVYVVLLLPAILP